MRYARTRIGLTAGVALAAVLMAAAVSAAQGSGRGGPGRFGGPGGPMGPRGPAGIPGLERVGLSDAQKEQLKTIMQSHQADLTALGSRERTAREALNDAITADVPNEGLIRARSADVAAVEADMAVSRARIRSEVLQILTPDQVAQLKQFQTQMKQRQESMRQHGNQPPAR